MLPQSGWLMSVSRWAKGPPRPLATPQTWSSPTTGSKRSLMPSSKAARCGSSVRDALSILLGGNVGEMAFTVGAGLFSGRQTLNTRQLLLVNLLTDVLPAMAVAVRPPPDTTTDQLLAEGPEASLGSALTRDIYVRAAATAGAATAAWLLARPASLPGQTSTTALVALVGAQL